MKTSKRKEDQKFDFDCLKIGGGGEFKKRKNVMPPGRKRDLRVNPETKRGEGHSEKNKKKKVGGRGVEPRPKAPKGKVEGGKKPVQAKVWLKRFKPEDGKTEMAPQGQMREMK